MDKELSIDLTIAFCIPLMGTISSSSNTETDGVVAAVGRGGGADLCR